MSAAADNLDRWIRSSFVQLNTELENLYFGQPDRANVDGVGERTKKTLAEEGLALIGPLAAEGNTNEGFEAAFNVLGNLGLFMAALRRHELTNPAREAVSPFKEASALGLHIGASLGVTPRFATAHLATHNKAVDGVQKSFTSLRDEFLFIDYNTMGILSYKRAAYALMRIPPLGISNRSALMLLQNARDALNDVIDTNRTLFETLDKDRFFYSVRPYYKPYRVGRQEYRGANAGDFSGINEIDLLLGLCRANDPVYSQLLIDKMLFMIPEDQANLRQCLIYTPLLDEFLDAAETSSGKAWFQENCRAFLEVCEVHGRAARQHHDQLFETFIVRMSDELDERHHEQLTASGPPLPVLAKALERLRDLRSAAPDRAFETAYKKIELLRKFLK